MSWLPRASRRKSVRGSLHRSCRPDRAALWRQLLFQRNRRRGTQWLSRRSHRVQRISASNCITLATRSVAAGSISTSMIPLQPSPSPQTTSSLLVVSYLTTTGAPDAHHLLRTLADVALKTTATQNASSLAALSDQHSRARSPVRRALNRNDSCECCELALPERSDQFIHDFTFRERMARRATPTVECGDVEITVGVALRGHPDDYNNLSRVIGNCRILLPVA